MGEVRMALEGLRSTGPNRVVNYGTEVGRKVDSWIRELDNGTMDYETRARLKKAVRETGYGLKESDRTDWHDSLNILRENKRRAEARRAAEARTLEFASMIENLDEIELDAPSAMAFPFAAMMAYLQLTRSAMMAMAFPWQGSRIYR